MSKFSNTLIAGIIIGILIAPDKGSNTRRKLSQRARDIRNRLPFSEATGTGMAPMARDSGLSREISPQIADNA